VSLLLAHPPALIDREFRLGIDDPSGRVEVWDRPEYACGIGLDAALGIPGRDYDALVVLDPEPTPQGRYRQVGECHGHWGPRLAKVAYAACMYWREAFLVGERQVGHLALDTLWSDFGYQNLYRERNPNNPSHPMAQNFGHPRVQDDIMTRRLRQAIMDERIEVRSPVLRDQLRRCQFYSPQEKTTEDRVGDERMKIKLIGGGSPDLMIALGLALMAVQEMPRQEVKRKKYAPDTLGAILGHNDWEFGDEDISGGTSWAKAK
jgi:hypothetical protein